MDTRIALITGASSGIGRACAAHLAARGIRVYGTSRNPPTFTMLRVDVTDDQSVQSAIAAILQREGRLDIVVNNAGIAIAGPLELTSIEEAKRQIDVNLFGAFRVCRAVLPIMRRQGGGYIVNVGSIGGLIAIPYQPLYSASKLAPEGMTESLAWKYGRSASAWSSSSPETRKPRSLRTAGWPVTQGTSRCTARSPPR